VPAIHPLLGFGPTKIFVCTYQALSGAGKTLETWPEMNDNVIPFIPGEEEKSETEPHKVWGEVVGGKIQRATTPVISAQCIRVPVSDGHMAAVSVAFERKPSREHILSAWSEFGGKPQQLSLPSAPKPFLHYFEDDTRPQTRLDRDAGRGQAVTIGRLRPDPIFDWRFVALSHNTVRGAAGGGVLTAELLASEGYLSAK
jgi:aspartate-semialdehyde dehydrogenase